MPETTSLTFICGTKGSPPQPSSQPVTSNLAAGLASNSLLMTCWVLVHAPNGSVMKVRALLDSASSASFVSERLTHLMEFPRTRQNLQISGVAGLSHATPSHSIVQFAISPVCSPADKSRVSAIVVPRVTCDLPVKPVTPQLSWSHISDISLADPDFGRPSRINLSRHLCRVVAARPAVRTTRLSYSI